MAKTINDLTSASILEDADQLLVRQNGVDKNMTADLIIDYIEGKELVFSDLSINGSLTVSGTTTTLNTQELTIEDNVIIINKNQTGVPPSSLVSGLEVERGDLDNYQFMFRESDDTFVIGQIGSLQAVATRQNTPTANTIPFWNNTEKRLDSSGVTVSGSVLSGDLNGTAYKIRTSAPASPTNGDIWMV